MIVDRVCRSLAIGHTFSGRDSACVLELQDGVREICTRNDEVVSDLAQVVLEQANQKLPELATSLLARISARQVAKQEQFVRYFPDSLAIEVDGALTAPAVTTLLALPVVADEIHLLMAQCLGLGELG
mmetsp:Transcript_22670/g.51140  ORF Transcript_22670/g.51140 Transcript_22670/m.51140 type:complete len:128 (+) Transcript_22670:416-799(+)